MFNLRNYINQTVKEYLKDSIIENIKADVIKELEDMSEYKVNLKKYKIKQATKQKLNVWSVMQTLKVDALEIDMTYVYKNGATQEFKQTFKTMAEMNKHIKDFVIHDFKDKDIVGFKEIKFYVWYYYKSKKRNLVAEYFLDSSKDVYEAKAYEDVMKTIGKFFKKHPELII